MTEATAEGSAPVQQEEGLDTGLRVSEKIVVADLRQIRSILADWVKDIDKASSEGQKVDIPTYRAELSLCAAKLEALVHAEL